MTNFPTIPQAICFVLIFYLAGSIFNHLFFFIENHSGRVLSSSILSNVLLLFFVTKLIHNNQVDHLQLSIKRPNFIVLLFGIIAGLAIFYLPLPEFSYLSNPLTNENEKVTLGIMDFMVICLIAPISEEVIFRGVIVGGLIKRFGPVVAIIISSLLFAFLHMSLTVPFCFALLVGFIYLKTRNLLYSIIIHILMNLYGFMLNYVANLDNNYTRLIETQLITNTRYIETIAIIVLLICVLALFILLKKKSVSAFTV